MKKKNVLCTVWISTALLPGGTLPSYEHKNTISMSAYNFAAVGLEVLVDSERVATEILAAAGVSATWTAGTPLNSSADLMSDFSAVTREQCAALPRSEVILLQIYPQAPKGFAPLALGYALPCALRGVQVTVYADRVEAVSRETGVALYRILGHALAHEIGHVLLRSTSHESTGLMKSVWSKRDWQRAGAGTIPFSAEQAAKISSGLAKL